MAFIDISTLDPAKTIVVSTGNAHKVVEIEEILGKVLPEVRFVALGELGDFPDAVEDGETFFDNALIKARYALACTGLAMAVADDSGLCVDALGGAPGVWSARWAGEHGADDANNEKLMREMADVPEPERTARFHSSVVLGHERLRLRSAVPSRRHARTHDGAARACREEHDFASVPRPRGPRVQAGRLSSEGVSHRLFVKCSDSVYFRFHFTPKKRMRKNTCWTAIDGGHR